MKRILSPLALLATATPALAHSGAHLHPHSVEGWVGGLGVLLIGAAATVAVRLRK